MSSYDPAFNPPGGDPSMGMGMGEAMPEPKTSVLAIVALVLAIIAWCPCVGLIGPLLGVIALIVVLVSPHVKGAGIAIAAIVIGLVLQVGVGYVVYDKFVKPVQIAIEEAPANFITAAESGDTATAQAQFAPSVRPGADEINAFGAAFRDRYGSLTDYQVNEDMQPQGGMGEPTMTVYGTITTTQGSFPIEIDLIIFDEAAGVFEPGLDGIRIKDPANGDLVFPMAGNMPGASLPAGIPAPDPDAGDEGG